MVAALGHGIYTFKMASRLTRLSTKRIREWFHSSSVLTSDYSDLNGESAISFLDLIDVRVTGQLRENGVSLTTVRKVYQRLAEEWKTPHPFCRKELLTDGKIVFYRHAEHEGEEELREVLSRQKVFPQIMRPFLKQIDYSEINHLAERWRIATGVVLDPEICFGKPIVEAATIPTSTLAEAWAANGEDAESVADWFEVRVEDVEAAVRFEQELAERGKCSHARQSVDGTFRSA